MADYISMKQVPGGTVTATDDRILYDYALSSGIIYGCEISYLGNNMIHINGGYGIIKGGLFEMEDHTEYVNFAESVNTPGQIYLHLDLAADDKLTIVKETSAAQHVLVQNDNANFENGVYEIQLCTFTATTTALENVTQTFPMAAGAIDFLDTLPEIMANTNSGKVPDALAIKTLNTNLTNINLYVGDDGMLHWVDKDGADSALPFSPGLKEYACGEMTVSFSASLQTFTLNYGKTFSSTPIVLMSAKPGQGIVGLAPNGTPGLSSCNMYKFGRSSSSSVCNWFAYVPQ